MYKLISLTPIINIFKVKDTYKDKDQAGSISMLLITSTPNILMMGVREMSLYMP